MYNRETQQRLDWWWSGKPSQKKCNSSKDVENEDVYGGLREG